MKKIRLFVALFLTSGFLIAHPFQTFLLNAIKTKQEKIACTLIAQSLKGAAKSSEAAVWILLKEAIKHDCSQVVKALLRLISVEKLSHKDESGYTLLDYAHELNRLEIIEMLNKKMASVSLKIT